MHPMKLSHDSIMFGVSFVLVAAFLGDDHARAGTLYQTGFEPPIFSAGQPVDGQDVWVATLSPSAGIISANLPVSGLQSLQVNGNSLDFYAPDGLFEGVYNPITLFNAGGAPLVWVQADVRLVGPLTADDLASANLFVANTNDVLAESYVSSDGHFYGLTTNEVQQFGAASLGTDHRLGLLLDLANLQGQYYLDGQLLGTLAIPSSVLTDSDFVVGVELAAAEDTGGFSRANYTGYFDNVSIATVPEPSAAILLVSGIAVLACAAGISARSRRFDLPRS
jgi:hypothetical protein